MYGLRFISPGAFGTITLGVKVAGDLTRKTTYVNCPDFSLLIDFRFNLGILGGNEKSNENIINRWSEWSAWQFLEI